MKYSDRLFYYNNLFITEQLSLPVADIFQVSELSVVRGGEISGHVQFCDEITYAVSGSARFYENDNTTIVSEGQIHFIKKDTFHKIEVLPDENFRYICIGYNPCPDAEIVKSFYEKTCGSNHFTIDDNGTIKHLAEYMLREFYNSDNFSRDSINSYLTLILTTILRIFENKEDNFHTQNGRSSGDTVYRLLRYLDREYMHIENLSEVSEELSYSRCYLSHIFKEKMGISIKEYLTNKKITHGAEMLLTSDLSIEKIAEALHFSCAHTFRRSFKDITGLSPADYRKKLSKENKV